MIESVVAHNEKLEKPFDVAEMAQTTDNMETNVLPALDDIQRSVQKLDDEYTVFWKHAANINTRSTAERFLDSTTSNSNNTVAAMIKLLEGMKTEEFFEKK